MWDVLLPQSDLHHSCHCPVSFSKLPVFCVFSFKPYMEALSCGILKTDLYYTTMNVSSIMLFVSCLYMTVTVV